MKFLVGCLIVVMGLMSFQFVAQAQEASAEAELRSPWLFALSSFLVPGLGQMLQNEAEKAFIHFSVALLLPLAGWVASWVSPVPDAVLAIAGLGSVGWAFLSSMDAYRLAKDYNKAITVPTP